ncbi:hypothetical protein J6590_068159 [Homalodisca vitripennis]|nr:hypothetical protein J6590_068159 [Homalodisca vitripennis]
MKCAYQLYLKDDIEKIQRRFLRLADGCLESTYPKVHARVKALMPRYDVSASADELDYDEFLWKLNLRTPTGTISKALIFPPSVSISHAANGDMWLQCQGTSLTDQLDLFISCPTTLKDLRDRQVMALFDVWLHIVCQSKRNCLKPGCVLKQSSHEEQETL